MSSEDGRSDRKWPGKEGAVATWQDSRKGEWFT